MQALFTQVNISDMHVAIYAEVWFLQQNFYLKLLCPSDGTLNGAPCQELQPPWHAKDRFAGFWWRVGSWGPPGKLQNFINDHISLIVAAVTWLKYCRYGVKLYPINRYILLFWIFQPCSKVNTVVEINLLYEHLELMFKISNDDSWLFDRMLLYVTLAVGKILWLQLIV